MRDLNTICKDQHPWSSGTSPLSDTKKRLSVFKNRKGVIESPEPVQFMALLAVHSQAAPGTAIPASIPQGMRSSMCAVEPTIIPDHSYCLRTHG